MTFPELPSKFERKLTPDQITRIRETLSIELTDRFLTNYSAQLGSKVNLPRQNKFRGMITSSSVPRADAQKYARTIPEEDLPRHITEDLILPTLTKLWGDELTAPNPILEARVRRLIQRRDYLKGLGIQLDRAIRAMYRHLGLPIPEELQPKGESPAEEGESKIGFIRPTRLQGS